MVSSDWLTQRCHAASDKLNNEQFEGDPITDSGSCLPLRDLQALLEFQEQQENRGTLETRVLL